MRAPTAPALPPPPANATHAPVSTLAGLARALPASRVAAIAVAGGAVCALLLACLLLRVLSYRVPGVLPGLPEPSQTCLDPPSPPRPRSGWRWRKPRKYDIITTPAERVEMAPLKEEEEEDEEEATVFDIKYR